jgi:hypothetical protein
VPPLAAEDICCMKGSLRLMNTLVHWVENCDDVSELELPEAEEELWEERS